ncbi:oncoprotein-induced transcript 3 protein-like [Ylistrum balloti]|uniref:oncoprotein-induced transcript 3 protein-like n=1 Tax=Ylistrum balloti TaxID=509963 RepID=UPI002905D7F0|nr:oncoprotein-induced transcript 3 protein-like [Ylistrum balloti]
MQTVFSQDPCSMYTEISVDGRRWPNNTDTSHSLCDNLIVEDWYRFTGFDGTDLVNNTVPSSRCGTDNPLWMNGNIPATSDGIVSRTVCTATVFISCHVSFEIQVKNCCSYRVYYLKPPGSCSSAYCIYPFAENEMCFENTSSTYGSTSTTIETTSTTLASTSELTPTTLASTSETTSTISPSTSTSSSTTAVPTTTSSSTLKTTSTTRSSTPQHGRDIQPINYHFDSIYSFTRI